MMKPTDASNSLSPDRAFVVQLHDANAGAWPCGRVEHVASGRARRFAKAEELLAFMKQTVDQLQGDAGRAEPPAPRKRRTSPPALIRFLSSRLGVRDRREAKLRESA